MNIQSNTPVTELLAQWSAGNEAAAGELMPLVYDELRRMAQRHLRRERPDHTLQRTALVHEAFLRLVNQKRMRWQGRAHFLGLASQLMRRILVDHARGRLAEKRGLGAAVLSLDETVGALAADEPKDGERRGDWQDALAVAAASKADLVAIDQALTRLERIDPQQGRIVELRFFGGLTIEETAQLVGISDATVKRDWPCSGPGCGGTGGGEVQ
jgi:RNA polymerase sigma factor (sigma-70 family)